MAYREAAQRQIRSRWRDYQTASGRRPVKEFILRLPTLHAAEVAAAMKDVAVHGLSVARHLRDEIFEIRVSCDTVDHRILFAREGKKGRILLALEAFEKKTPKTPTRLIDLAESRLQDWRRRGHKT